ncbi:hypothetical protein OGAPHI_001390 [Ogataea philodendri]|uniref:t-SNARE coiled-coil homology domain-containing protein n=1 Tax=Ogataea philodendri TaxID=1378263 RepID=A0A9P8PDH1_9ASCO|nr:uncharacterized protein OGAPHI_001390 [Ogataea philodendri]KAH3669269.1 hypothetical protein OGAPHI_001390 [Ogataea philodendri]
MDPFEDVYKEGISELGRLRSTSPNSIDFNNIKIDLIEIINDLDNALEVIQQSKNRARAGNGNDTFSHIDDSEVQARKSKLDTLKVDFNKVLQQVNLPGHYSDNPFQDPPAIDQQYTQQLLQEQDDIISHDLTRSIQTLHQQALTIGTELDHHQELLDDVEHNIDRLNFKLVNNGIKKINRFLETNQRGGNCCIAVLIAVLVLLSSLVQGSVHLARAQNNSLDASFLVDGLSKLHVLDQPLEVRLARELRDARSGQWVSQQTLGEKHHQWLSELTVHLSSDQVEQRSWSRWVRNLDVAVLVLSVELLLSREEPWVLITQLQVSLYSSGRVLWTLSVVTVRQRQNNSRSLLPLGLTSSNELVNNDLRSIGKVTELGFPDNKSVWRGQRVSVLKSHHTVLRKRGIADHEISLVLVQVLQWDASPVAQSIPSEFSIDFNLAPKILLRFLCKWKSLGTVEIFSPMYLAWSSGIAVGKWGKISVANSFGDLKPSHGVVSHSLESGFQVEHKHNSFDIVSIHVENWSIDSLGNVRRIWRGSSKSRVGGETDLVIHNHVDGTSCSVGRKSGESHGLVNNTLTSEGGVSMQKNTNCLLKLADIVLVVLDCSGSSENNWVLGLQVRWVSNNRQSSSVGHTNDNVLNTKVHGSIYQSLQTRHHRLGTLHTKSLIVWELGGQEVLELTSPHQTIQDLSLLVRSELEWGRDLGSGSEPVTFLSGWNVDVFDTIRGAVDFLAGSNHVFQFHGGCSLLNEMWQDTWTKSDLLLKVGFRKPVVFWSQLFRFRGVLIVAERDAQRINVGLLMATHLVRSHKQLGLQMDQNALAHISGSRWNQIWDASFWLRNQGWRSNVGARCRLVAVHVAEVCVPRHVDTLWVVGPCLVHLVDVVGVVCLEKAVKASGQRSGGHHGPHTGPETMSGGRSKHDGFSRGK